jgi:hypothetical protein
MSFWKQQGSKASSDCMPIAHAYIVLFWQAANMYIQMHDYWLHVSSEKEWEHGLHFAHQRLTARTIDHLVQP